MKLVLMLAMILGASNVFATKARVIALGQDKDGSWYLDDNRNMFRNSAFINDFGNFATFEWGDEGLNIGDTQYVETDYDPKAEGGFFRSSGNFSYGAYLGSESSTGVLLKSTAAGNGTTFLQSDNVLELFVGGRHTVDWGVGFGLAPGKIEADASSTNKENKTMFVRLGVKKDNWDAYANVSLQGETEFSNAAGTADDKKYDGGAGWEIGGSYEWNGNHFYGELQNIEWDAIDGTTSTAGEFQKKFLGWGRVHNAGKSGRVNYDVEYTHQSAEIKYATNPLSVRKELVRVNFGYEHDVKSWLTLRGSVNQNLLGQSTSLNVDDNFTNAILRSSLTNEFSVNSNGTDTNGTIASSTVVNAGASLKFGNLTVDGLIGTGGPDGNNDSTNKSGALALDRLMTRVSMAYTF